MCHAPLSGRSFAVLRMTAQLFSGGNIYSCGNVKGAVPKNGASYIYSFNGVIHVKKTISLMLALTLTLALSACGTPAASPSAAPTAPAASPTPTAEPDGIFTVETDLYNEIFTADDGTELLDASYSMPLLSGGAEGAAEKINTALSARKELFMSSEEEGAMSVTNMLKTAKETIELNGSLGSSMYGLEHSFSVARCDGALISFKNSDYAFSGGAHGFTGFTGQSFNAVTGEELKLDDLSADGAALRDFCLRRVSELAAEVGVDGGLFEGYEEYLVNNIEDGFWYFSEEGLTFIYNAYDIGSYAAGPFEFTIPYAELSGVVDAVWLPTA